MKHFSIALLLMPVLLLSIPFFFVGWLIYFILTWVTKERMRKRGEKVPRNNFLGDTLSVLLKKK